MAFLARLTIRGFLSSLHNRSAHRQKEFLQKSQKVFDTKSQHGFFHGVPQGHGVLMWYF